MARVTVEDCKDQIPNRFDIVLAAARRARQIYLGDEPKVDPDNDKPTVIALREISEGFIDSKVLDEPENLHAEEELVIDLSDNSNPSPFIS